MAELSLEARQAIADQLAPVAVELAARVRDEHPDVLLRELLAGRSWLELASLCLLLAAAADDSASAAVWWGWFRHRDVLEHPSPMVWPEDHLPIEELDSAQISGLIERLAGQHKSSAEIAEVVQLSPRAVAKRLERLRAEGCVPTADRVEAA